MTLLSLTASLSSLTFSDTASLTLKFNSSSLKRKFSAGIKPDKNTLIPYLTDIGIVTTPYAPGVP